MGSRPVLFSVPGNHDLTRPNLKAATRVLTQLWHERDLQEEFWETESCEYRTLVKDVFKEYLDWSDNCGFRHSCQPGILPGDFSATMAVDGFKFGIAGLNSTFLQLTEGDYQKKLALDSRQLHKVCNGDLPAWVDSHHVCFLLTHQGPEWLNEHSQETSYAEIHSADQFALHLYGHMHEHQGQSIGRIGGSSRRTCQGCSLFGMEYFGKDQKEERRHGYSIGQIEVEGSAGKLRIWPRAAVKSQTDGWFLTADPLGGKL
jgi:hypothetical protein